jgi:hypothetical protein
VTRCQYEADGKTFFLAGASLGRRSGLPEEVVTSGHEGAIYVQCVRDDHVHYTIP